MVWDREKVFTVHLRETGVGLSESAILVVVMATEKGKTLQRSPRKVCIKHQKQTVGGLSKSAIILISMAMCVGDTLNLWYRNADKMAL